MHHFQSDGHSQLEKLVGQVGHKSDSESRVFLTQIRQIGAGQVSHSENMAQNRVSQSGPQTCRRFCGDIFCSTHGRTKHTLHHTWFADLPVGGEDPNSAANTDIPVVNTSTTSYPICVSNAGRRFRWLGFSGDAIFCSDFS